MVGEINEKRSVILAPTELNPSFTSHQMWGGGLPFPSLVAVSLYPGSRNFDLFHRERDPLLLANRTLTNFAPPKRSH